MKKGILQVDMEYGLKTLRLLLVVGKVTYFKGLLAIADSGNNRIIISTANGLVKVCKN
jgi:hypothetical protein